tara:strand:- start:189 stop:1088 length:900 start_codon:yes stop_codon:yes gene_type:complete
MPSSHNYKRDKRNDSIKIYIDGKFYLRNKAKISVFDSGFLLGDGIWTSLRLHNNKLIFLDQHISRLYTDAKAISLKLPFSRTHLKTILFKTISINKMSSDVHIRLIVSRGIKSTPYQDPSFTISKPTLVIIPEFKVPDNKIYKNGLVLKTVNIIRGPHNVQDPRINSLSKLNCILACIEAKNKKGDEALMFDINGNIATNNSTHFFYIKNKKVFTSKGKYCVKGITRKNVIKICKKNNIKIFEKNFKLKEVLKADEAFITGTFANIIPVKKINNKKFQVKDTNLTNYIKNLYLNYINKY